MTAIAFFIYLPPLIVSNRLTCGCLNSLVWLNYTIAFCTCTNCLRKVPNTKMPLETEFPEAWVTIEKRQPGVHIGDYPRFPVNLNPGFCPSLSFSALEV
ncbi:hypothetical protein RsoM2USA_148 [Ralstonia phage RsoM2USA]|nr:hypothetical protein RsoM2USA_148 [Ralstonia phage RsoM2USA]